MKKAKDKRGEKYLRFKKRKPAFNLPDHAGLISTSNVSSMQINLN
jgi:hypothetical protein